MDQVDRLRGSCSIGDDADFRGGELLMAASGWLL
jgi:hypothetical protein